MPDFQGARMKLGRAQTHLDAFKQTVTAFVDSEPNRVIVEPNPEYPNYVARIQEGKGTPREWGLIVGDFAHNARSVLDHIVFEASTVRPTDRDARMLQFPIVRNAKQYQENMDDRKVFDLAIKLIISRSEIKIEISSVKRIILTVLKAKSKSFI